MSLREIMTDLPVGGSSADSTAAVPARSIAPAPEKPRPSPRYEHLYPALSGVLMTLAFPPLDVSWLAFVALLPLLFYLDRPFTFRRTALAGILCGAIYFGSAVSWLVAVGKFSWLIFPGYTFIVCSFILNFFFFIIPVAGLKHYLSLPFLATAPFAWVLSERLRVYGDVGFPWTAFGYSLTHFPFLLQFADVVGVYGVGFWLVLINVLLFQLWKARASRLRWRYAAALLLTVAVVLAYDTVRWFGHVPESGRVNVAILQPNIAQRIKWEESSTRAVLAKTFAMNAVASAGSPQLTVWPETAIPYYISADRPFRLDEMGWLPPGGPAVLTGLLEDHAGADGRQHFYNSAELFDPTGTPLARYRKLDLVPGSERYPFRRVLGFTRQFFSIQHIEYGAMEPGDEATVFQLPSGAKFSVLICYESAFPDLSRDFRNHGAQFLVNITNDAWFGHSFAAEQHASFLVMRAIEERSDIVRSGNTGFSGFVDPWGRWQQKTELFTEAIVHGSVPLTDGRTFYTRFGDLVVGLSYLVMAVYLLLAIGKKLRTKEAS